VVLETERLLLRDWRRADLEPFAQICADPEVMRFVTGAPQTFDEVALRVLRFIDHQRVHGFTFWPAELRATGSLIGVIGLLVLELDGPVEIGWRLERASWGQGLATEGALACSDYAFAQLGLAEIIARYSPENRASERVMIKLGMRYAGLDRDGDARRVLTRAEWDAVRQPRPA
jgi:RimJ/RimL family protein N-acetyltransferase